MHKRNPARQCLLEMQHPVICLQQVSQAEGSWLLSAVLQQGRLLLCSSVPKMTAKFPL
jgi:hypothetical protein